MDINYVCMCIALIAYVNVVLLFPDAWRQRGTERLKLSSGKCFAAGIELQGSCSNVYVYVVSLTILKT